MIQTKVTKDRNDTNDTNDRNETNETNDNLIQSNESLEPLDDSYKTIESQEGSSKKKVFENELVYCAWNDPEARDEMAKKLNTKDCTFTMVIFHILIFLQ